ncbi:hypothetical protein [Domibacillus enclensis]|uniref:Uncharacterized protein n=1 Tax=Domibacillus enclensis TaxID=1017273 RepID=A0A1N7BEQ7_9BACI|nr:hypothetical protein [Domibacillus enclensis]OXS74702.1 hypothetical protein B1B05_16190 [Domibacillus enclensis]SIR49859.1 hypothetical protein SAMN05443094_10966 [Domibacillus enclensis]
MLSASGIQPIVENEAIETALEQGRHNSTYRITISFKDREQEHVGDLDVYFIARGFREGNGNEEIDVHFTVPFFSVYGPDGERFMEEAEAMQFIFINFASEVQEVVDAVLDELYDQLED